ncbi:MAG: universal stress protein [Marivivens sp.]|nr:universal stress protein [Marivivens sp.]
MYKKILVPLALNHGISEQTLGVAQALLSEGGEITALHVFELPQGTVSTIMGEETIQNGLIQSRKILNEKVKGMKGVRGEIVRGHAYRSIVDFATENDYDCIVIGSHKPGLSDYLIGSTAARVVRHAPCAVHVHRDS